MLKKNLLLFFKCLSIGLSLLFATLFRQCFETGYFFHRCRHEITGIIGSVIGIWLLGFLVARIYYAFQYTGNDLQLKKNAWIVFYIAIILFGAISLLAAYLYRKYFFDHGSFHFHYQ
jgi:hypothetical protein